MEYSKEDLMEAKKQIWGVGENMGTEESKKIWEENAQFWDNAMGDESNEFHREVVRPKVTELLSPNPADYILDIACGNGNYSSYLAQRGASVVAFDYSKKMIELAKRRQSQYAKQIEFCVADATDRKSILELKRNRAFTKAVSNMAIMDITDIEPLLMAVYELLQESGIFVFATQHPCFVTLTEKYMTPHSYQEYIQRRYNAFCKTVIRCAALDKILKLKRQWERQVSLDYLMNEKFVQFAASEPDEEYPFTVCGQTVLLCNAALADAISVLPEQTREEILRYYFLRQPQRVIGACIGRSRSTAGRHIQLALQRLREEMGVSRYE